MGCHTMLLEERDLTIQVTILLKLGEISSCCCNFLDDPWMAAHQFLEQNDLSQMFLDQVVDFIQKNTKGVTTGQQASSASDPFTGKSN